MRRLASPQMQYICNYSNCVICSITIDKDTTSVSNATPFDGDIVPRRWHIICGYTTTFASIFSARTYTTYHYSLYPLHLLDNNHSVAIIRGLIAYRCIYAWLMGGWNALFEEAMGPWCWLAFILVRKRKNEKSTEEYTTEKHTQRERATILYTQQ